jgi:BMFP domain-containing protein YqiC
VGVVKRDDFDVVRDMARKAREENDRLLERIAVLEARLGITPPPAEPRSDSPSDTATH